MVDERKELLLLLVPDSGGVRHQLEERPQRLGRSSASAGGTAAATRAEFGISWRNGRSDSGGVRHQLEERPQRLGGDRSEARQRGIGSADHRMAPSSRRPRFEWQNNGHLTCVHTIRGA